MGHDNSRFIAYLLTDRSKAMSPLSHCLRFLLAFSYCSRVRSSVRLK